MLSAHGAMSDPGPASTGAHGVGMMLGLQTVISLFWDNPRIYNLASNLLCALLLFLWVFVTLRSKPSPRRAWLALAAIAPLSMLILYHRQIDAMLLLLTVPACAMLWAEGRLTGKLALLATSAGFIVTGYLPWAILLKLMSNLHLPATGLSGQIQLAVEALPAPLTLLTLSVFYLWVYLQRCLAHQEPQADEAPSAGSIADSELP
jgi:hypothetical protein